MLVLRIQFSYSICPTGGFLRVILIAIIEGGARNATPRPASNPEEGIVYFGMMGKVKKEMFQEGIITEVRTTYFI